MKYRALLVLLLWGCSAKQTPTNSLDMNTDTKKVNIKGDDNEVNIYQYKNDTIQ